MPNTNAPHTHAHTQQEMSSKYFSWARTVEESEVVNHFKALAKELAVVRRVTCVSFFTMYTRVVGSTCGNWMDGPPKASPSSTYVPTTHTNKTKQNKTKQIKTIQ